MRSVSVLALALAAALPFTSLAQQKQPAPPQQPQVSGAVMSAPGAAGAVAVVDVTATVEAVDKATRTVSLKGPKGNVVDVVAGEEVRNFDQIKKGDKLKVKYAEALTLELKKDGKAVVGRSETEAMKRAQPGQKPGGGAIREVTVVADVVAVDPAKKTITLKGPKQTVELNVMNPDQFKVVKVGDKVEATYTQALAISMEAAAAAGKKPAEKKK
jgi:hypothetical protein